MADTKKIGSSTVVLIVLLIDRIVDWLSNLAGLWVDLPEVIKDLRTWATSMSGSMAFEICRWAAVGIVLVIIWEPWRWLCSRQDKSEESDDRTESQLPSLSDGPEERLSQIKQYLQDQEKHGVPDKPNDVVKWITRIRKYLETATSTTVADRFYNALKGVKRGDKRSTAIYALRGIIGSLSVTDLPEGLPNGVSRHTTKDDASQKHRPVLVIEYDRDKHFSEDEAITEVRLTIINGPDAEARTLRVKLSLVPETHKRIVGADAARMGQFKLRVLEGRQGMKLHPGDSMVVLVVKAPKDSKHFMFEGTDNKGEPIRHEIQRATYRVTITATALGAYGDEKTFMLSPQKKGRITFRPV